MQLGSILDDVSAHIPTVYEPVAFWLNLRTSTGLSKVKVKALLGPLSRPEETESARQAEAYLRTKPDYQEKDGKLPPIPALVVNQELDLRFLFAALRDADDPSRPLVEVANYERFRLGMVDETIVPLIKAYKAYMEREYPSAITDSQRAKLEEEAKGK